MAQGRLRKGIMIHHYSKKVTVKRTISLLMLMLIFSSLVLTSCDQVRSVLLFTKPANPGELVFEDDFSTPPNGWGTMERDGGEISFVYDGMMFSVFLPNFMYWSVNGNDHTDTRIEVDAVLADGPTNDNFGVICRFKDDRNFYGFVLSHDGYYGIFKYVDGRMVMASDDGNMGFSDAIRRGGVVNRLQATCKGNVLTLSANDVLLAEVVDDSFQSGKIGLIAGAYDEPGVVVFFDNFKVFQP